MLTKTDLDTALSYYPHIAEQIKKVARDRANLVNKLNEIVAKAAAEGKSAADTAKAVAQGTKDEDEEKDSKKEKENEEPATAAAATSAPAPASNAPAAKPAPAQSVSKEGETEQGQMSIHTFIVHIVSRHLKRRGTTVVSPGCMWVHLHSFIQPLACIVTPMRMRKG